MRTRFATLGLGQGTVGIAVAAVIVVGLALAFRTGLGPKQASATFDESDLERMAVSVEAIELDGLISREEILATARQVYDPPDPEVQVDAFAYRMTDPRTLRSDRPLVDHAVWIVRYSGLTVQSPGGVELHYAYEVFDALSGEYLGGHWSP